MDQVLFLCHFVLICAERLFLYPFYINHSKMSKVTPFTYGCPRGDFKEHSRLRMKRVLTRQCGYHNFLTELRDRSCTFAARVHELSHSKHCRGHC